MSETATTFRFDAGGHNPHPFAQLSKDAAVAYDPRAPQDEVRDAGRSLVQECIGAFAPPEDMVVSFRDMIRLQDAEKEGKRLVSKALKMLYPEADEARARTQPLLSVLGGGGTYVSKPGIPFQALRTLGERVEVAQAIMSTRVRQVTRFSQLSTRDDAMGFRIMHRDPEANLSPDQADYCQWLTAFLLNGGREFDPSRRRRLQRSTFRQFLAQLTEDTLILDHVPIETVPLRNGVRGLDSFHVRDGATFMLAAPGNEAGAYAYQVAAGLAEVDFSFEQLSIFQRNLSPSLERRGYARSELEKSIDTMTNFLHALAYTREGMDNNAIPRGILTVYGQYDRRTKDAFVNAWANKVRGVQNAHGLPVLFSANGQAAAGYTQTGQAFTEMAFAKWISLQTAIMCAIYGMDPKEIGMEGWQQGTTSSLGGDDTKEKIAASQDKGLQPLLSDFEGLISDDVIARFSPDYRAVFTGKDPVDEAARRTLTEKVSTINELRQSLQMEPHPLGWFGDLPADDSLLSAEFQRICKVATLGEGRKVWGFKDLPEALAELDIAPLEPSLQSLLQGVLQPEPPPPMPGEGNPFGQGQGDGQFAFGDESEGQDYQGEGEDIPPPPTGAGKDMAEHLNRMRGEE